MKAITIKQPWASLIVEGIKIDDKILFKDIENRTWKTNYRGRVLIHAASTSWTWNMFAKYLLDKIPSVYRIFPNLRKYEIKLMLKGAIIGSVEITDCVIDHSSIWAEKTNIMRGDKPIYNWVLTNPIKFAMPMPCKGALSFWECDPCKLLNDEMDRKLDELLNDKNETK